MYLCNAINKIYTMTTKNTIAVLGILISFRAFSQKPTLQVDPNAQLLEISINKIIKVSENKLSSTLTAHTVKLVDGNTPDIEDDSGNPTVNSTSIEGMIDTFLSVSGVSRCTFDNATQTFTILSTPETSLTVVIASINNI